jgi:putative heme-binding domain-containing protein
LQIFSEAGPAESGLSFDSRGRKFVSSYNLPLMSPMYESRYAQRNPYYARPNPLALVADPAAPVYRFADLSGEGARGRQVTNVVVAGSLTSARGCVIYRGRAFPTNYFDNAFIASPEDHLIHRLVLQENGLNFTAQRAPDESNTEFLLCNDPSFRPVQIINGPDGALYIADMQDGNDRGRIYRVLPDHLKRPKLPQLGKTKTYDLVGTLAQGDGWHRDTAARLLYERQDPAAAALLRGTLTRSRLPQARVSALHGLLGARALTDADALIAMADLDPLVREHGILVSESLFRQGDASEPILSRFRSLVVDPSPRVRYQLALTLGELERADKAVVLGQILSRDFGNPWFRNAILSSPPNGAGQLLTVLAGDAQFRNDAGGIDFLQQLSTVIGTSGRQEAVTLAANYIARGPLAPGQVYALLYSLGNGLYRTRSSLALVDVRGALQGFYSGALNVATDPSQPESVRAAATQLLGVSTYGLGSIADWLLLVCSPPTGPYLQSAAVDTLARYDNPQVVNGLLQMWPILAPMARARAINALISRDSHVNTVLDAIQSGKITAAGLSSAQRNFLRTHSLPAVQQRALQLLGPVLTTRGDAMERFKPALTLRGSADRGQNIFRQRCAECHFSAGQSSFGPALLRAMHFSRDQLLSSILQPNLAVRPDYVTQVLVSKEGLSMVGIISDETPSTVTLKQIGGNTIVWPRLNIEAIQAQDWSLMPEGLELGMTAQDMADLLDYLSKSIK